MILDKFEEMGRKMEKIGGEMKSGFAKIDSRIKKMENTQASTIGQDPLEERTGTE